MDPKRSIGGQNGAMKAKHAQGGAMWRLGASKKSQSELSGSQEGTRSPRRPHDGPKEGPRGSKEGPKGLEGNSKGAQRTQ